MKPLGGKHAKAIECRESTRNHYLTIFCKSQSYTQKYIFI